MKIFTTCLIILTISTSCSIPKQMRYYTEETYWKKYQEFLPTDLQYSENNLPIEEYWSWKDYEIHLDRMNNPNSPVKIIILHGAGGNGRIVGLFGNFLSKQGYEYIAPDLIGYGLTHNSKNININYSSWVDCISDLIDIEYAKDNKPIVLFGLSLGGMLAYQVAAKNDKVRGIIVTTLADPRYKSVKDDLAKNKFLSRIGLPIGIFFKPISDPIKLPIRWVCKMDRITNDKAFSSVFSKDKLGGGSNIKLKFLRTYMNFIPAIEPENFKNCEVLFLQPEKDTWTTIETSKPFYDRLNCSKKLVLLKNCGHAPYEESGLTTLKIEAINFLNKLK
jgi:alpha-beta hydrolase superfamily lysophospholipase